MVQSDLGEASPKSERDWKSNLGMKKCKLPQAGRNH